MSFSVIPASPAAPTAPPSSAPHTARQTAAAPSGDAVTVDTMSSSPPPEVLDAIGVAARAADALEQSGHRLQFSVDAPTGRVTTQLIDHSGSVRDTLTGAQVLSVAAGVPLT